MGKLPGCASLAILEAFMWGIFPDAANAGDVPRMSKEELKAILGSPDLVIIDVRTAVDWNESKLKIPGAVREGPEKSELLG